MARFKGEQNNIDNTTNEGIKENNTSIVKNVYQSSQKK